MEHEKVFVDHVLRPLIGDSSYITDVQLVEVSQKFLENVEQSIDNDRPIARKHKVIDVHSSFVQLMPHFGFLDVQNNCSRSYSVEIKPKWGFLPSSSYILCCP